MNTTDRELAWLEYNIQKCGEEMDKDLCDEITKKLKENYGDLLSVGDFKHYVKAWHRKKKKMILIAHGGSNGKKIEIILTNPDNEEKQVKHVFENKKEVQEYLGKTFLKELVIYAL